MPRRKTTTEPETNDGGVATLEAPAETAAAEPFNKRQLAELNIGPKPMKKLKDFEYVEDLAAYLRDFESGADGAFEFLKIDSTDAELIRVELTRILGPEWLPAPVDVDTPADTIADPGEPTEPEPTKAATPAPSTNGQHLPPDVPANLKAKWREVQDAKEDWEAAKEEASSCRRIMDKRVDEFDQLMKEAMYPPPLFAQADRATASTASSNGHAATPAPAAEPATDESWRTVPLSEALIELSDKVIEKLRDADLKTVGDLANYTAADGGRQKLTDIKGIGTATAEKIEEAMEKFWQRRRQATPAASETETPSGETNEPIDGTDAEADAEAEAEAEEVDEEDDDRE